MIQHWIQKDRKQRGLSVVKSTETRGDKSTITTSVSTCMITATDVVIVVVSLIYLI